MPKLPLQQFLQNTGAISAAQATEIAAGFQPRRLARHGFMLVLNAPSVTISYFPFNLMPLVQPRLLWAAEAVPAGAFERAALP